MRRINRLLSTYQPLVQTVGIVVTAASLAFAAYQCYVARLAFELSHRQFVQQQTPLWEFGLDDRQGRIKIGTKTPDVHLDRVSVVYPNTLGEYSGRRIFGPGSFEGKEQVPGPDFNWDLSSMDFVLGRMCSESPALNAREHPIDILFWPETGSPLRAGLPVGLELRYTYRGESRTATALYRLPFSALRRQSDDEDCMVQFSHPQLVRYLETGEDTQAVLNEILREGIGDAERAAR